MEKKPSKTPGKPQEVSLQHGSTGRLWLPDPGGKNRLAATGGGSDIRPSPVDMLNVPLFARSHTCQVVFSPDFWLPSAVCVRHIYTYLCI